MKRKKYIIIGFLVSIWLPFLLITDMYPFLRFGMFAESAIQYQSTEYFLLKYQTESTSYQNFDTNLIGLDESMVNYMLRTYYYQQQLDEFADKLIQSYKNAEEQEKIKSWQIWQLHVSSAKTDSVLIKIIENR